MTPEQIQLAERIVRETDSAKLSRLVAELCAALDQSLNPSNLPPNTKPQSSREDWG